MTFCKRAPRKNLSLLALKNALKDEVSLDINGWEILGDLMIIEVGSGTSVDEKKLIGKKIVELHPRAVTVINRMSIEDEFREPRVELIAGEKTETVYKENGCLFSLDPTKVMFSFGNKEERMRMGSISSGKETVIDMFACVGQFTIPVAKHSGPKKVYSIEKNPVAFEYLIKNIKLNKLLNAETILGDCRDNCPVGVAQRVIMGYLFKPWRFLPAALSALDEQGTIHYHFVSDLKGLENEMKRVMKIIVSEGFLGSVLNTVRIKSYAPKKYHYVMDIEVSE
jgi:tRNA wybutosine-synthesizing protein 2